MPQSRTRAIAGVTLPQPGPCPITTFDPDIVGSNVPNYLVFSNNNLTVTGGPLQGQLFQYRPTDIPVPYYGTAIALSPKTTGHYYWEMHIDVCTSPKTAVGMSSFADQTEPQTGQYELGGGNSPTNYGWTYRSDGFRQIYLSFAQSISDVYQW
jgi:hypothetical protein